MKRLVRPLAAILICSATVAGAAERERGWRARYFPNVDFRDDILQQTDLTLDHDWQESPPPGVPSSKRFSVSWSAWLTPPATGDYVLKTVSDDGICLWVDDRPLIQAWGPGFFRREVSLRLEAGTRYYVQVLYANFAGTAEARLQWKPPGTASEFDVIPAKHLVPALDHPRLFFFRPEPNARLTPLPLVLADVIVYDPDRQLGAIGLEVHGSPVKIQRQGPSAWHLRGLTEGSYQLTASAEPGEAGAPALSANSRLEISEQVNFDRQLAATDICIPWRWASPDEVLLYGCNVLGWGPGADSAELHIPRFRRLGVDMAAFDVNLIILGPSSTPHGRRLLEDPDLRRTLMLDIQGEPARVTWWRDALWRCPLNAASRAELRGLVAAGMQANPDLLHLDGALATLCAIHDPVTGLGCFCDDVALGFNDYLGKKYSPGQLRDLGIENLADFDYRAMLKARFPAPKRYASAFQKRTIPLIEEYRTWQFRAIADLYRELINHARGHRGKHIPLAANLNSLRYNMLPPVDALDLLYCEMRYVEGDLEQAVVPFKLAETLGIPLAALVDGHSVRRLKNERIPNLIRRWIALTTAMGANFCIPSLKVMQMDEGDMESVRFERELYVNDLRFVRENPVLFDGYQSINQIGVLYSMADQWSGSNTRFLQFCQRVFDLNLPFCLPIAGDDRLTRRLTRDDLASLDAVLVPGEPLLDPDQRAFLDRTAEKVCRVPLSSTSDKLRKVLAGVEPVLMASQPDRVWMLPRYKPDEPRAPLVVHVINRQFDPGSNRHEPIDSLEIQISHRLFDGSRPLSIVAHSPDHDPRACSLVESPGGITVTVPRLTVWCVLQIERVAP